MADGIQSIDPVVAPIGNGANWLLNGFDYFKKGWGAWVIITIVLVIISIVAAVIPILGNLAFYLFWPTLMAGLMLGCSEQDKNGQLNVGHLFAGFSNNLGQLVTLGVLYILATIVLIIIMVVMVFMSVGGLEVLSQMVAGNTEAFMAHAVSFLIISLVGLGLSMPILMLFWFAPALVVLDNVNAIDAMKLSFKGCLVNVLPFLIYGLVGLVLAIIAAIPIMLGWLILFPMITASIYISYKEIYKSGGLNAGSGA